MHVLEGKCEGCLCFRHPKIHEADLSLKSAHGEENGNELKGNEDFTFLTGAAAKGLPLIKKKKKERV